MSSKYRPARIFTLKDLKSTYAMVECQTREAIHNIKSAQVKKKERSTSVRKNYSSKNINVFEFNENPQKSRKDKIK